MRVYVKLLNDRFECCVPAVRNVNFFFPLSWWTLEGASAVTPPCQLQGRETLSCGSFPLQPKVLSAGRLSSFFSVSFFLFVVLLAKNI